MKKEKTIEVIKKHAKFISDGDYYYANEGDIEESADELQTKELSDEEIIASIPYPEAISKHQTDINIGWIRCRKYYRKQIKQL